MTSAHTAASVHQRILNKAVEEHRPFNELLQYYAMERFLYRLGESPHCQQFVLKGAMVFLAWEVPLTRPTRDMDFLGYTEDSVENLVHIVQDLCGQPVEADGMIFDPTSVQGEVIKEEADYPGVRITFLGYLGKAKIRMQLDVGFADVVTPSPDELELPTLIKEMHKPCVYAYPPETVIAEKFHTMIAFGKINSRMKDFYDIWFMAQTMEFDFNLLREAILNTLKRRKTDIPEEIPTAFTNDFASQKQGLWEVFLNKNQIETAPKNFLEVTRFLFTFLDPVVLPRDNPLSQWSAQTGWKE